MKTTFLWIACILLLSACTSPAATAVKVTAALPPSPAPTLALPAASPLPTSAPPSPVPQASPTRLPSLTPALGLEPAPTLAPTADTRLDPADWQNWPVIPALSARARLVYLQALAAGRAADRFSKVGDCQNITSHFLGAFDQPGGYLLGEEYAGLQEVIAAFSGSWGRESQAVRPGYNVAAVLSAFQADPKACAAGETPLDCEVRLYNPSIALVSMETWYVGQKLPDYEKYLRQVIERLLNLHVLPILATKADNLEGSHTINQAIARLAYEYDLPLWNFWRAVQPLPGHGLVEDGFHLTRDPNHPADPLCYRRLSDPACIGAVSWAVRNLTAVQVLDAVWRSASK